jgi:hypothetical protein
MRIKIDCIKELIESEAINFRDNNSGDLTTLFFAEPELKNRVSEDFYYIEIRKIKNVNWGGATSVANFDEFYAVALREFKSVNTTTMLPSISLQKVKSTWLNEARKYKMNWNDETSLFSYRERYFAYLKKQGRSEKILRETKRSSLSIVEKLGDPKSATPFYVRGMVVGSVQSGKTANFNGVINSAIDAGYQLVIVLSGIMEDLRVQTQKRIDKDVIGAWQEGDRWLGVGAIAPFKTSPDEGIPTVPVLKSITSSAQDFNRNLYNADFDLNSYNIMICKKNVSVLANILLWLKDYTSERNPTINIPLLIIDDEADNASLNNNGNNPELDPTKINIEMRAILNLFSKKTYLGYTATPFANILHDRNELKEKTFKYRDQEFKIAENFFPDDFIELLYPPSDYIGIKHFFETKYSDIKKIDPLIAPVIVEEDLLDSFPPRFNKSDDSPTVSREKGTRAPLKSDEYPMSLPDSLKDAVKCFILVIALRLKRRPMMVESELYQPHNSMLIHISRFGSWQNRTKELIIKYVSELEIGLNRGLNSKTFSDFQEVWNKYYLYIVNNIQTYLPNEYVDPYMTPFSFMPDVRDLLVIAIANIEVKSVNSTKQSNGEQDNLIYPSKGDKGFVEKKYIAIGGNRLSRGFTLEGLTVNYFLRGTDAADTLMQMGRWFGYRPGYLDCCKLFTTQSSIDKFDEASLIIEDLEIKFERLSKMTNPPRTPSDFTLWIKNNPAVIKLTRGNFLRKLERKKIDFSSTVEQSTQFRIVKNELSESLEDFKTLMESITTWQPKGTVKGYLTYETNSEGLLEFLNLRNTMVNLNRLGLEEYLENCEAANKLTKWIVAIRERGEGRELPPNISRLPYNVKMIKRSGPGLGPSNPRDSLLRDNIFKSRNATIISASDFAITLSKEQRAEVVSKFREEKRLEYIAEGIDPKKASEKAKKVSAPDYAYREAMDESTGILVIYLMDLDEVFTSDENDMEMINFKNNLGFTNQIIPIIGCALGFPAVSGIKAQFEVSRHVFKEHTDMTIEELLAFANKIGLDIDASKEWTKDDLLKKIKDGEEDKDLKEMNLYELKQYVIFNNLVIDIEQDWTKETLFMEILNELGLSSADED